MLEFTSDPVDPRRSATARTVATNGETRGATDPADSLTGFLPESLADGNPSRSLELAAPGADAGRALPLRGPATAVRSMDGRPPTGHRETTAATQLALTGDPVPPPVPQSADAIALDQSLRELRTTGTLLSAGFHRLDLSQQDLDVRLRQASSTVDDLMSQLAPLDEIRARATDAAVRTAELQRSADLIGHRLSAFEQEAGTIDEQRRTLAALAETVSSLEARVRDLDTDGSPVSRLEADVSAIGRRAGELAGTLEQRAAEVARDLRRHATERDGLARALGAARAEVERLAAQISDVEARTAALTDARPALDDARAAVDALEQRAVAASAVLDERVRDALTTADARISDRVDRLRTTVTEAVAGLESTALRAAETVRQQAVASDAGAARARQAADETARAAERLQELEARVAALGAPHGALAHAEAAAARYERQVDAATARLSTAARRRRRAQWRRSTRRAELASVALAAACAGAIRGLTERWRGLATAGASGQPARHVFTERSRSHHSHRETPTGQAARGVSVWPAVAVGALVVMLVVGIDLLRDANTSPLVPGEAPAPRPATAGADDRPDVDASRAPARRQTDIVLLAGRAARRARADAPGAVAVARRIPGTGSSRAQEPKAPVRRPAARDRAGRTLPPAPFVGDLAVHSMPVGAVVFVDQKPVGTTPVRLKKVRAGSHAVRVALNGFEDWSTAVRVAANQRTNVATRLQPSQE